MLLHLNVSALQAQARGLPNTGLNCYQNVSLTIPPIQDIQDNREKLCSEDCVIRYTRYF